MRMHLSYFLFECKRSCRKFGRLILTSILLAAVCGGLFAALSGSFDSSDSEPAAAPFTVVIALPKNAGLHYNMAVGMVAQMDSFRSMCTVLRTDSEEEAMSMLESGDAKAAVLIPEGMIHSILDGSNLPARIIYPASPSIETVLFRNLVESLSRMLAASQSGVYALYDIYDSFHLGEDIQDRANSALNSEYINMVLARSSLFSSESLTHSGETPPYLNTLSGLLGLLLLLTGTCLCDCLCPHPQAAADAFRHAGIGSFSTCLAPVFGAWAVQFCLYALLFLTSYFVFPINRFLPALNLSFLASLAVCVFFAAALQFAVCRICRIREASIIGLFLAAFVLVFAAGGLLPAAFLPTLLRRSAVFNPVFYLCQTLAAGFSGTFSVSASAVLLLSGLILTAAFAAVPLPCGSFLTARRCGPHLPAPLHRPAAWICFFGKRTLHRPVYWLLMLAVIIAGISACLIRPDTAVIPVGIYCDSPDSFTDRVIDRLLNRSGDHLYRFYRSASVEDLQEDILGGYAECGYLLPDQLLSVLNGESNDTIHALTGPSSVLTELIHEEVYAAAFDSCAPAILADYIREAGDLVLTDKELAEYVSSCYGSWAESGSTFRVEYEDTAEGFFENRAAFELPLRGIFSLLLLTAVMAGMAQYRYDRRQHLLLIRRPFEGFCISAVYCLFPALLLSAAGLLCLDLNGQLQNLLSELVPLFTYLILLALLAQFFSFLIRSPLIFDALIPILVIFCILYAPVITDLSSYLPGSALLSLLAPSGWYLRFF